MEKEPQQTPWTHRIGVLAWAPLPVPLSMPPPTSYTANDKGTNTAFKSIPRSNTQPKDSQVRLLWPCILYPSWARAVNKSHDLLSQRTELHIIGCSKPTSLAYLRRDNVPSMAALGTGYLHEGKYYRKRVVAHFLGIESEMEEKQGKRQSWSPVHVHELKPYTVESCRDRLEQMWKKKGDRYQYSSQTRENFILAMTESSIVMENGNFDPNLLFRQLGLANIVDAGDKICTEGGKDAQTKEEEDDEVMQNDCTPECFDDWKVAGDNTQRLNGSNTQNFSQSLSSTQGSVASVTQ